MLSRQDSNYTMGKIYILLEPVENVLRFVFMLIAPNSMEESYFYLAYIEVNKIG
jgi:hypothetical protein